MASRTTELANANANAPDHGSDLGSTSSNTLEDVTTSPEIRNVKTKDESPKAEKATKMAKVKALWAKTGLDVPTLKVMAKGALAPTISLAAYVNCPSQPYPQHLIACLDTKRPLLPKYTPLLDTSWP